MTYKKQPYRALHNTKESTDVKVQNIKRVEQHCM
jgi:hypothetical protein